MPQGTEATFEVLAPGEEHRAIPPEFAIPGVQPTYQPGDFILTHTKGVYGILIRFGQSLRYHGDNAKYARWNHAALIVSEGGDLVEALSAGVVKTNIEHYKPTERYIVHVAEKVADKRDRQQAVDFAGYWCQHNEGYGWTKIVSIGLALLTGCKFSFGIDGQFICSGLVASALERTSTIFDQDPANMSPADLAKHFNVTPPPRNAPKGRPPRPSI
jgi:uncharacterized protein YycO